MFPPDNLADLVDVNSSRRGSGRHAAVSPHEMLLDAHAELLADPDVGGATGPLSGQRVDSRFRWKIRERGGLCFRLVCPHLTSVSTSAIGVNANIRSVTSQGSAYGRFRKALDRRLPRQALIAGRELEHVGLADALELVLLLRDKDPLRFPRSALRWHARFVAETRTIELAEASAVLGLLAALDGDRGATAARALAELCDRRDLHPLANVLLRWAEGRQSTR